MLLTGILPFSPLFLRCIFIPAQILFLCWAAAISLCYFYPPECAAWPAPACRSLSPQTNYIVLTVYLASVSWAWDPESLIFESGPSRWQLEHYCNSSRLTKYFLVKWHWNVFKYFITADCFITEISYGSVQDIRLLPGNRARGNGLKKQGSTSSSTVQRSCKTGMWIVSGWKLRVWNSL